jgi:nicotinate-nucleotide adenylyltransferase
VVGGTFDPVHVGHLAMAEAAADCAALERVLLVVAARPPHRPTVAPARDRLAMCRLAAAGHRRLEVSDLELRRSGPSYTADTLAELAAEYPGDELHLVLGWDAARELRSWHRPEQVLRLARLVVVPRPGYGSPGPAELVAAGIDPSRVSLCPARTPEVESTELRRAVCSGRDLAGLLDPAVEAYIRHHRLYACGPGDQGVSSGR